MAGEGAAPVPYVYQPTATGEIPSSTTTQESSTNTTTKGLDPRSYEAYQEWLKAQDAQAAAQQSPTLGAAPSAEDVDADIASQASSQQAIERQAAAKTPDPFDPSATNQPPLTSMGGLPGLVPTQATQKPPAPADDMPRSFTSQEFRATPEIRGPQTLAAAQDEAAAYQAQQKAKLAATEAQQRAAIEAERARRLDEAIKRMDAATLQYQKDSAKLFEKPSTFTNIMRGIASGLGAYGAIVGHSQNFAQQAIEAGMQHDLEEKKAILAASLEKMKYAGLAPEHIQQWAQQQQQNLLAQQQAQLNVIESRAQTMLAPFPQQQAKVQQVTAELREKQKAEAAKFLGEHLGNTREEIGEKVTTVAGDKAQGRLPSASDVGETATADVMARKADRLEKLDKEGFAPTPEEIVQLKNNERQFLSQAHKEGSSTWSNLVGQVGRGAGIMPNGVFPEGMRPETKEWFRLQTELAHAQAVKFYGGMSWMTNPETYQHAMAPRSPQMGDDQDAIKGMAASVIEQARTVNKMMREASKTWREVDRRDAHQSAAASAPVKPSLTGAELSKLPAMLRRDYVEAAKVRPKDPDYVGAQSALRRIEAEARKKAQ